MSLEEEVKNTFKRFKASLTKDEIKHPGSLVIHGSEAFVFRYPLKQALKNPNEFIELTAKSLMAATTKQDGSITIHHELPLIIRDNAFFQSGKSLAKGKPPKATVATQIEPERELPPETIYRITVAEEWDDQSNTDTDEDDDSKSLQFASISPPAECAASTKDMEIDTPNTSSPFSRKKQLGFYKRKLNFSVPDDKQGPVESKGL